MAFFWLSFHCTSGRLKVAHDDDDECRRGQESTMLVCFAMNLEGI